MLDLLRVRKEELLAEKAGILAENDDAKIAELVEAYRAELLAKYASDRASKVNDLDLEAMAIDRLIAKEEAKALAVQEANAEEVETVAPIF